VDPLILVALIGLPANLLIAFATYSKAKSTDSAVNHRVSGTTVSEDIADIRREQRIMHSDIVWLTREVGRFVREDRGNDDS
jgi:hypothetical protein